LGSITFAAREFVARPVERLLRFGKMLDWSLVQGSTINFYVQQSVESLMDFGLVREAISILMSNLDTQWRALELRVIFVFLQAISSGDAVLLECTNENGVECTSFSSPVIVCSKSFGLLELF
jgi:hypothetical protein